MLFGGKLLVDDAALGLTNALDDDLLCSLCGYAAELLCLNGNLDGIADLGTLGYLLRSLKVYLKSFVLDLLNGNLVDIHLDTLSALIKQDFDIVSALGIITAEGRKHRLLYLVIHVFPGNALFFFKIFDCREKFCVHFLYPFYIISICAALPAQFVTF